MASYPSSEMVQNADRVQLGRWLRFLPSPGIDHIGQPNFTSKFDEEILTLDSIQDRFVEMGGWTPAVSKAVGLNL